MITNFGGMRPYSFVGTHCLYLQDRKSERDKITYCKEGRWKLSVAGECSSQREIQRTGEEGRNATKIRKAGWRHKGQEDEDNCPFVYPSTLKMETVGLSEALVFIH
jgi:hypothetical protein